MYDHPAPPETEGSVESVAIPEGPITDDFFNSQGLKTAKKLTELKDYLGSLLP